MSYHDPNRRVCAVCKRVLDFDSGTNRNVHPYNTGLDHEPVPVADTEVDQVVEFCDFCYHPSTEYEIPAQSFRYTDQPTHGSADNWAACTDCALMIGRNDWNGLVRRVTEQYQVRGTPLSDMQIVHIKRLWRQLRPNITGPPRRLVDIDW